MDKITSITKTCESNPEQYEGTLESGKRFYMRCRFGYGELRVGTEEQWNNWTMPTVAEISYPDDEWLGNFKNLEDRDNLLEQGGIDPKFTVRLQDTSQQRFWEQMNKMENPPATEGPVLLTSDDDVTHKYPGKSVKMAELLADFEKATKAK